MKPYRGDGIRTDAMEHRHYMSNNSHCKICSKYWVALRVWSISTGDQKYSVNDFKLNVHKNGVTAKYVTSEVFDTVSAFINVAVFCCVMV